MNLLMSYRSNAPWQRERFGESWAWIIAELFWGGESVFVADLVLD
jgi:hypothetical protein